MKPTLVLTVALASCLLCGCDEPKRSASESIPAPEAPALPKPEPEKPRTPPTSTGTASSTAPAATAPTSAEPAPAVPEPPKKPEVGSTVWASTRISVTSDDGVFGVPAGTKLRIVKVTDSGFVATDEKREFPVTEGQISTGAAAAASAAQSDQAQRAADAAWHKAQLDAVAQQREAAARNAQAADAEKKTRDLQTRLDALVREEAALQASIDAAQRQDNEASTARFYGRTYTRSITPQQRTAWEARLALVRVDRNRVQYELSRR